MYLLYRLNFNKIAINWLLKSKMNVRRTFVSLEPDCIKYTTTNIHDAKKINSSLTFLRIFPAPIARGRPFTGMERVVERV